MSISSKKSVLCALTAISMLFTVSCKHQTDYKQVRQQVLDLHDKVMNESGTAQGYMMQFDAILKSGLKTIKISQPTLDTAAVKSQIIALNKTLTDAHDEMDSWMHSYNNDFKGKTDQETITYFTNEKVKLDKLDSHFKEVIKSASDYLKQLNIKPDTHVSKMKM